MPIAVAALLVALLTQVAGQPDAPATPDQPVAPEKQPDEAKPDGVLTLLKSDKPEKIADGFRFTEGPLWHPDGFLIFSDIPADTIYRWSPDGSTMALRNPAGHPNGNALDADGRLVTCEHDGRLTRTDADSNTVVLVDAYEGKSLNSPNDLIIASTGAVYFTDRTFGLRGREAQLEQRGVYRLDPDGSLHLLSDELELPNGVALAPDEKTLYVSDSRTNTIYTIDLTGAAAERRVFAEMKDENARGIADGLKLDRDGNVYAIGPGGLWLFNTEGRLLGRIGLAGASNICFGGADGTDLYITARDALYRLPGRIPGCTPPETGRSE